MKKLCERGGFGDAATADQPIDHSEFGPGTATGAPKSALAKSGHCEASQV
jgi:hypothetical protein